MLHVRRSGVHEKLGADLRAHCETPGDFEPVTGDRWDVDDFCPVCREYLRGVWWIDRRPLREVGDLSR